MRQKEGSDDLRMRAADTTVVYALDLAAPDCDFALQALRALTNDAPLEHAKTPETAIIAGEQNRVVILLRSPHTSLALALAGSDDPVQALDVWIAAREALVAKFRQARRRVTLVDIELFESREERAWGTLCRRLGIQPDIDVPTVAAALRRPSPIHDLAAQVLIQSNERAKVVAEELNLATLGPGMPMPAADSVMTLLATWKAISSQVADLMVLNNLQSYAHDTLQSENIQVRTEMGLLQENLTFAVAETEARCAKLAALQAARDELAAGLEAAQAELKTAQSELALLRDGTTLQCALSEQLAERAAAQQKTIHDLRSQLGDHLLTRAKSDALLKRLGTQVEAELRVRSVLGAQILADARVAREMIDLRETLAAVSSHRDALAADRAEVAGALAEAREELAKILSSKSWRLTSPLRNARRQLSR